MVLVLVWLYPVPRSLPIRSPPRPIRPTRRRFFSIASALRLGRADPCPAVAQCPAASRRRALSAAVPRLSAVGRRLPVVSDQRAPLLNGAARRLP